MGGLSLTHLLLFAIILLVFFGPARLPGLGKSLGEAIRGFKKGLDGSEIDVTESTKHEQLQPPNPSNQVGSSASSPSEAQNVSQNETQKKS